MARRCDLGRVPRYSEMSDEMSRATLEIILILAPLIVGLIGFVVSSWSDLS